MLHLSMSHTPVDAPPEFLRPQRSVAVPASPRARARMRQAQSSAHPGCHPCCHPCTLRGLAQSILGVRLIFLDEENRKEPLSKMSAEAQTPEQRISSSHKQLPEIGYDPCFRGAPCLDDTRKRGVDLLELLPVGAYRVPIPVFYYVVCRGDCYEDYCYGYRSRPLLSKAFTIRKLFPFFDYEVLRPLEGAEPQRLPPSPSAPFE